MQSLLQYGTQHFIAKYGTIPYFTGQVATIAETQLFSAAQISWAQAQGVLRSWRKEGSLSLDFTCDIEHREGGRNAECGLCSAQCVRAATSNTKRRAVTTLVVGSASWWGGAWGHIQEITHTRSAPVAPSVHLESIWHTAHNLHLNAGYFLNDGRNLSGNGVEECGIQCMFNWRMTRRNCNYKGGLPQMSHLNTLRKGKGEQSVKVCCQGLTSDTYPSNHFWNLWTTGKLKLCSKIKFILQSLKL